MKFCIIGSGAVGGYFGAKLVRGGHDVTFIARGAHLAAMREQGLTVRSPMGDFTVQVKAEEHGTAVGPVDVVIFAVKNYSNRDALPLVRTVIDGGGQEAVALTLQNGVDSADQLAAAVGAPRVLGGTTYVATVIVEPGVIKQTGSHRRIVFGEVGERAGAVSARVTRIHDAFTSADITSEPQPDARVGMWEKFCYLAPFAAFSGAARLPKGPLWSTPATREAMIAAIREVEAVGRAEGVALPPDLTDRLIKYSDSIPDDMRSSLLADLQQGKPIELEALAGAVVRRGRARHVPTPVLATLYAVLKPHAPL